MATDRRALGELLAQVEGAVDAMARREASAWLVVCVDLEAFARDDHNCVVACYGPFDTPEEALVEAGRHQETSLEVPPDEAGWAHLVKPLFPKIEWRQ